MLSSSLDTLLELAKTTSPQKLFAYDCKTLYYNRTSKNQCKECTFCHLPHPSHKIFIKCILGFLTLSGLGGGGQYCPLNLWEALKQKLFGSVIYNFLTIPKYVLYILWFQTKKIVICTLTGVAYSEGVQIGRSRYVVHILNIFIFPSIIHILSCSVSEYI